MQLFTNEPGSSIRNAFYVQTGCAISFASPFYSYPDIIHDLIRADCKIRLLVTFSSATTPNALRSIVNERAVDVRFMPIGSFHTKLYLFGNEYALVGSSNLTNNGLNTNKEVCVKIPAANPAFSQLCQLFESYWSLPDAKTLTPSSLAEYERVYNQPSPEDGDNSRDKRIGRAFPWSPASPTTALPRVVQDTIRKQQNFLQGFRQLSHLYEDSGIRRNHRVPLNLEIDQFLSFVYTGNNRATGWSAPDASRLPNYLAAWKTAKAPFLMEKAAPTLDELREFFGTPHRLRERSPTEIAKVLTLCHAVRDRERHFDGGLPGFISKFARANRNANELHRKLDYLLRGEGDYIVRIARCAKNGPDKIHEAGDATLGELYGWLNSADAPIFNNRSLETIEHLGLMLRR